MESGPSPIITHVTADEGFKIKGAQAFYNPKPGLSRAYNSIALCRTTELGTQIYVSRVFT
jgi:hypothetical protein